MNLRILTLALLPLTASAQTVTFGVQGGFPTQTPLGSSDTVPFAVGPLVNIRILSGLSLETGVQYRGIGRKSNSYAFLFPENGVSLGYYSTRGRALEFPLLAKYRFLGEQHTWRPFLAAGPTVRRTSITSTSVSSILSGSALNTSAGPQTRKDTQWKVDPTFGAGVDFRTGRFHFEPEVRYSYWSAGKTAPLRKNQTSLLLGFRF